MSNRGRRTRATRAKSFVPGSRLGLMAQQIMMKLVLREAFTGLLRLQFGAQSLLEARDAPALRAR